MRIIKPYGKSVVTGNPPSGKRLLEYERDKKPFQDDIANYIRTHDEPVIAQWISVIDKIIKKPKQDKNPSKDQRDLRCKVGDACWALMLQKNLLPGMAGNEERKQPLRKIWDAKISPYGKDNWTPGKEKKPYLEGRWYRRFLGTTSPENIVADELAGKIHDHLYNGAYWIASDDDEGHTCKLHEKGLIEERAASIAKNVLSPKPPAYGGDPGKGWGEEDEETYRKAGVVIAAQIKKDVESFEEGEKVWGANGEKLHSPLQIAAERLHIRYGVLFRAGGKVLKVTEAREQNPGLLALHLAIKDCYTRLLKRRKDAKEHKTAQILPADMEALFKLVKNKGRNRDVNHLVRLGRIIHYTGLDELSASGANMQALVEGSDFWTSAGQARIKRNEALVRIWRHVLALANRSLTDWADPYNKVADKYGDIIGGKRPVAEALENFESVHHCTRIKLLFGNRHKLFIRSSDTEFGKRVMELALWATKKLRDNVFHFKGVKQFVESLTTLHKLELENKDYKGSVLDAVKELYEKDQKDRFTRIRDTMEGAHFGDFFYKNQNERLLDLLTRSLLARLTGKSDDILPLPRFGRMMQRATDAWKGEPELRFLPDRPNRNDLETSPARKCQYQALKMLYDGPFRQYVEEIAPARLKELIDNAVERATTAARKINGSKAGCTEDLISSRATRLASAGEETVEKFFFRLSEATATEMRVQNFYESDGESARKQAEYIEDLKCDVLALAFCDYIKTENLTFITRLRHNAEKSPTPCAIAAPELPPLQNNAEKWPEVLYFILHLVPVEELGKLLHQLRKWKILATPEKSEQAEAETEVVRAIRTVLLLYLEMHDAKFDGGERLEILDDYSVLFAHKEDFEHVFKQSDARNAQDERLPLRGLREMLRFGGFQVLEPVFRQHCISRADVKQWEKAQEEVAAWQKEREELHKKRVRSGKGVSFEDGDQKRYAEVLKKVTDHRHQAAHVTLTNHVRLHRLLMQVLGRLVDYAGLWERDLYFVTLALVYEEQNRAGKSGEALDLRRFFNKEGTKLLKKCQVVNAVRNLNNNQGAGEDLKKEIEKYLYKSAAGAFETSVDIRNEFAHFNMLRHVKIKNKEIHEKMTYNNNLPDLSGCVNCARSLMEYDRKLKNAVSKSIIELLDREGLELSWKMPAHQLEHTKLSSKTVTHFREFKLNDKSLVEKLHGDKFVNMAASLFGAEARGC